MGKHIYCDCSQGAGELRAKRQLCTMYAHELLSTFAGRCAARNQDGVLRVWDCKWLYQLVH